MIDKWRRRMNGREEYITTEITQKKGGGAAKKKKREAQRKEEGFCVTERGWQIPVLERGVPSP